MIYTSYFGKMRSLPDNFHPVAICQYPPKWYEGVVYKKLAPSGYLLKTYKENADKDPSYWEEWYNTRFHQEVFGKGFMPVSTIIEMINLFSEDIRNDLLSTSVINSTKQHLVLMCFEKEEKDCHRHLVAEYFSNHNIPVRELTEKDLEKEIEEYEK